MQALRGPARLLAVALACLGTGIAHASDAVANSRGSLGAKYAALQDKLSHNQFQKPLYLDSSETPGALRGDIYALADYPFATVSAALNGPGNWCDILILHLNIKYCRASTTGQGDALNVSIGRKYDRPLDDAYRVVFAYRVAARTPDYLQVRLDADEGPLSTRNYRIVLAAIPSGNGQTFIHLSYSYTYGLAGRLAMQAYLGTSGRDRVGFTIAGTQPDGQPRHIGGLRGVVERNTMRYYLAIEAFLGALSEPQQGRFEKRLHDWFAASERYPHQLHEVEQAAYLDMKRREYRRQQAGLPGIGAGRLSIATP
ncbi:MAG TPA: hypothetical protein VFC14_20360 [Burkholderiales bacterium]|jgi:hypothetical protein|nr:hypothetical protein [Burkholderiales bacterium]